MISWRSPRQIPGLLLVSVFMVTFGLPVHFSPTAAIRPIYWIFVCILFVLLVCSLPLLCYRTTDNKIKNSFLLAKHFRTSHKTVGFLIDDHDIIIRIRRFDTSADYFQLENFIQIPCPSSNSMKEDVTKLKWGAASAGFNRLPPPAALCSSLAFWPRLRCFI